LDLGSAPHGIHNTAKFRQKAVAGVFDNAPAVFGDLWINQLPEMDFEPIVRALLIGAHQARIAGHVGGEDCSEAADRRHCSPGGRCA